MLENNTRKQLIRKFVFIMFMVSFALFTTYYTKKTSALILIATTFIVFTLFFLLYQIVKKCDDIYLINIQYMSIFVVMFFVPLFYSSRNMGNPTIYMMFLTFVGLFFIIHEKTEWLLIPISIISVIIHQDYIFMLFNIFLYLLIYKLLSCTDKKRYKKYVIITSFCLISVCSLFIYFEFFSFKNTELLNLDINAKEKWAYHIYNFIEFPIFCVFMLPYLILGIRLFKNIFHAAETQKEKIKYGLIPIMSLSIVPCYISEIHYGLLLFSGTAYYALVILALCALKDELVLEQLHLLMEDIKKRYKYSALLLVYAATMIPYYDIHINQVLNNIVNWIDTNFLHML